MNARAGLSIAVVALACSAAPSRTNEPEPITRGAPAEFAFGVLDGSVLTDEGTRGRVTALLFVTSFDIPSQAAARRLAEVQTRHKPRFNAAAIAVESAENATLVAVFRDTLGLPYPVAIADHVELSASPSFADIRGVPTLVLLDRNGRPTRRHQGLFDAKALERWLSESER